MPTRRSIERSLSALSPGEEGDAPPPPQTGGAGHALAGGSGVVTEAAAVRAAAERAVAGESPRWPTLLEPDVAALQVAGFSVRYWDESESYVLLWIVPPTPAAPAEVTADMDGEYRRWNDAREG